MSDHTRFEVLLSSGLPRFSDKLGKGSSLHSNELSLSLATVWERLEMAIWQGGLFSKILSMDLHLLETNWESLWELHPWVAIPEQNRWNKVNMIKSGCFTLKVICLHLRCTFSSFTTTWIMNWRVFSDTLASSKLQTTTEFAKWSPTCL